MSTPTSAPLPERPALRGGCTFTLQEFKSGPSWVLENPSTGKFFRLGLREEQFVRGLDGGRTIPELLATAKESGEGFTPEEMFLLLQTLRNSGLLDEENASPSPPPPKPPFNPMFLKMRLGNPDALLDGPERLLRPISLRWAAFPYLVLLAVGGYALASDFPRFGTTLGSVFSAANVPALLAAFIALKLLHEFAHGIACKRFGGHVPEVGLLFVFFMPLTYVDATSAWRFPSRLARILVSSAGILAELGVAAVAAIVWANTPAGGLNTLAANLVLSASVTTLLFNANPLMRFDGYFILADALGEPNLYTRAGRASSAWLTWLFLGVRPPTRQPAWLTAYGLSCLVWRTSLILGLCIGAIVLLHGIGVIMAGLTLAASYLPGLRRIPRTVAAWKERGVRPSLIHCTIWAVLLVAAFLVPVTPAPVAHGVIEPTGRHIIRVACPGFVREVAVEGGRTVAAGDLLFRLENKEEARRLATLRTDARRADARANVSRERGDTAVMAQHLRQAAALREQAAEAEAYVATLEIHAPRDGVLFARNLAALEGLHVSAGKELAILGDSTHREAIIALPQGDFDRIRPAPGDAVELFVPGRFLALSGTLTAVEASASRELRYEPLAAQSGGPLETTTSSRRDGDSLLLVDPHFFLVARLEGPGSENLRPGETALARFPSAPRSTFAQAAAAAAKRFVDRAASLAESRETAP